MFRLIAFLSVLAVALAAPFDCRRARDIQGYIVGGKNTNITEIPYQASLHQGSMSLCGAVIISDTYILSAAHCFRHLYDPRTPVKVRVGSSIDCYGGDLVTAKKIVKHPEFTTQYGDYDIAVLELERPIKFGPAVQPLKLADRVPPDGATVKASGWGLLKEDGARPIYLQSVDVPMVNWNTCARNYEKYMKLTPRMICAGVEGKDACQGDSGGPLAYKGTVVGIVSTGVGCARKDFPGIYANIADPGVRKFIREHTNM